MEAIAGKQQEITVAEAPAPSAGRSSAVFGITTAAVYSLALVKAIVLTGSFGTGPQMDAFTIALILPNMVASIAAANCGPAMVPVLASAAREGHHARSNAFRSTLWLSLAVSLLAVAGLYLFAGPLIRLIAPHFDGSRHLLAIELLRVLSILPAASIVSGYCSAELLSRRKYFVVAVVPAISTAVTIAAILSVRTITMLAYSVVAGTVIQAAIVLMLSLRASTMTAQLRLWTPHTRDIVLAQLPLMGTAIFGAANSSIDQALAALLPLGSASALNYATSLNALLVQSAVMSAVWVALPEFSDIAGAGDWEKLRRRARKYMIALASVAAPLSAAVILFAGPGIRIVFQRGAFTATSTFLVSGAWTGYAWGLVPLAIGMVCVRVLNSIQCNRPLIVVGMIMLPLNALLDLVLMRIFGVFGIGLSTSLLYGFSTFLLLKLVDRRIGNVMDSPTVRAVGAIIMATVVAAAACLAARWVFGVGLSGLVLSGIVLVVTMAGLYFLLGVFPVPARLQDLKTTA